MSGRVFGFLVILVFWFFCGWVVLMLRFFVWFWMLVGFGVFELGWVFDVGIDGILVKFGTFRGFGLVRVSFLRFWCFGVFLWFFLAV